MLLDMHQNSIQIKVSKQTQATEVVGRVSEEDDSMGIRVIWLCCDTSRSVHRTSRSVSSGSVGVLVCGMAKVEATAGSRLVEDISTIGTDAGWDDGEVEVYVIGWGWVGVSNWGDDANPLERMLMTCTTGIPSNATSNCCTTSACNKSAIFLMCYPSQIFCSAWRWEWQSQKHNGWENLNSMKG